MGSTSAFDVDAAGIGNGDSRYSAIGRPVSTVGTQSGYSASDLELGEGPKRPYSYAGYLNRPQSFGSMASLRGEDAKQAMVNASTTEALLWEEKNREADDFLHNPNPGEFRDGVPKRGWSNRGVLNVGGLLLIICAFMGVFLVWPIFAFHNIGKKFTSATGFNIGGINSTGQVPYLKNVRDLIDPATPSSAMTRTAIDGTQMQLVFSDEFNTDGRTFWPGDDPYWEAVDIHYWQTKDFEWYDPDAATTRNGNLEITITETPIHGLAFRSAMLQSWNKFCFSDNAIIEVNMSMPGTPTAQGFWPGVWTQGNLGRAGYGGANDGMWPYSYNSCDAGTMPNQTNADGTTPAAAKSSGSADYGGELSWLVGQRASACTCPGDPHPGPSNNVGRGAPEIDIIEAQVDCA